MATAEKPKPDPYFYVKGQGIKEKVLRGLEEDENPVEKKEILMPLGPGRYVGYTDRMAMWDKPVTMADIITRNDEKEKAKSSLSHVESSFLNIGDRRKQLSSGDRAKVMFEEAKDAHPTKRVIAKSSKGHPHETIGLPTIRLGKTLDDLYPSDEDECEEVERELASTLPVVKINEDVSEVPASASTRRVTTDTMGNISKFSNKLQSQIASSSIAEYATDDEQLELIMEHRVAVKTEVPVPFQILLYEETYPVIKSTVKAYKEILKKDNDLRIEAEEYLKKVEKKTKKMLKVKRQL